MDCISTKKSRAVISWDVFEVLKYVTFEIGKTGSFQNVT